MAEPWFQNIFAFVARHKRAALLTLLLIVTLCIAAATRIRYDNDISAMFPEDTQLRRDFALIRESVFAGKVVLSFDLEGSTASIDDLLIYVDKVAARLPGPLVSGIIKGPSLLPADLLTFIQFAPNLVGKERLEAFAARSTPAVIDDNLGAARSRLISFQGMFISSVVRADPLGLFGPELQSLQQLAATFGRNVTFYNGHFATPDNRHVMLILETTVPITDAERSKALIAHIQDCLKDLPQYANVDIIAGHSHTVANESMIKSDIARTVTVATIAYLIVLVCFFRDMKAGIFFLIPACSVLGSLVLSGLIFGKISAFVAALASVIIGVSDDYGILLYTAIRTSGRRDIAAVMTRPIVLAALFTTGTFAVFFFSSVPGYHQLALLTIISIWLCVGFVLFIFPHLVTPAPIHLPRGVGEGPTDRRRDIQKIIVWGLMVIVLSAGAFRVRFSSDISTLDGVDLKTRAGESRFEDVWLGKRRQGIFIVTAPTLDEALTINRMVYNDSASLPGITSIAPFMRPEKEQRENSSAWHRFWQTAQGQNLIASINSAAQQNGFSADAFKAFTDLTHRGSIPSFDNVAFLRQMSDRFVTRQQGAYRVLTFFPEEPEYLAHFSRLALQYPGSFIFSRTAFSDRFSAIINREAVRMAGLAAVLLCIVAVFFLRRVRLIFIVLSAALTAILAVTGIYGFWGKPLTAPALVALMIAVGLAIDYGIFLLYSLRQKIETGTVKAISISAATTLIGALSLLAARHPALFSIGLSLSIGLGVGWLSAQIVTPALYRLFCSDMDVKQ
jgi:predicted exporter